jgi:hypothetical protein
MLKKSTLTRSGKCHILAASSSDDRRSRRRSNVIGSRSHSIRVDGSASGHFAFDEMSADREAVAAYKEVGGTLRTLNRCLNSAFNRRR